MSLNDRQLAFLRALDGEERSISAGRVWRLACPDEPYRGRRDAGATRTLDGLERRGLATFRWARPAQGVSRNWLITDAGREALREATP